jgi:hypothetical protein
LHIGAELKRAHISVSFLVALSPEHITSFRLKLFFCFFFLSLQKLFLCCRSVRFSQSKQTRVESLLASEEIRKRIRGESRAASSCCCFSGVLFDGFRTYGENIQSMAICRAQSFTHVHIEKVFSASPIAHLHIFPPLHIHARRSRESKERYQLR